MVREDTQAQNLLPKLVLTENSVPYKQKNIVFDIILI